LELLKQKRVIGGKKEEIADGDSYLELLGDVVFLIGKGDARNSSMGGFPNDGKRIMGCQERVLVQRQRIVLHII